MSESSLVIAVEIFEPDLFHAVGNRVGIFGKPTRREILHLVTTPRAAADRELTRRLRQEFHQLVVRRDLMRIGNSSSAAYRIVAGRLFLYQLLICAGGVVPLDGSPKSLLLWQVIQSDSGPDHHGKPITTLPGL